MKPHPRPPIIRKTIKWGGAVVTVLLVVVWVGSGWRVLSWHGQTCDGFYIGFGEVGIISISDLALMPPGWSLGTPSYSPVLRWWPRFHRFTPGDWVLKIPRWMPTLMSLAISVGAWQRECLARRREQTHLCPKCRYDRSGLAAEAVCPECGAAAASR